MSGSLKSYVFLVGGFLGVPAAVAQSTSIELGAGASSEDSYRFGQYSGITSRGGFMLGGFNLQNSPDPDSAAYWQVTGQEIGLETGRVAAGFGERGSYSVQLNFDQIPRYRFNDGSTPFNGGGGVNQTLPAGWEGGTSTSGFAVLQDSLKQVNIDTRRQRYTGGFKWRIDQAWELMSEFRHETKQGNETLGAIFGSTGGNPRGSVVVRPIDYQTDEATVGLSYSSRSGQYNLSYSAMLFSNEDQALRFENPFNNEEWAAGAGFDAGGVGQISLEPDNRSHQLAFSGVQSLGGTTRLSGNLVIMRLEQDDNFLPYSNVLADEYPLPRTDLNGRVDSLTGSLNFSTRVSRQTTLRLRYNYRERDNRTPQNNYQRIAGDAEPQQPLLSEGTRVNRLYDLQQHRYSADLTYRLAGRNRLSGGLEWETTDRSMVDVAKTDETSGYLKWDFAPSATSNGWLKLSRAERDASRYDTTQPFISGHNPDYVATLMGNELFENDPLLRRYHLSDRDRDELSGSLNFFPSDLVGLSLLAKLSNNDYPDARVGISESENGNFAADLSLTPQASWKASLYYNFDRFDNTNRGYTRLGFPFNTPFYPAALRNPDLNWKVETRDRVHSLGGGVDWELLQGRLQLSLDASYTDAQTETSPASGNGFLPIPGATTDDPLPDVRTEISSISLHGRYQLQPGRQLAVRYYFEDYNSADWAIDGIDVDSLANVLLPGTRSFNYSGHLLFVSLIFDLANF
ncbi:MAG: MtrB/PioB family decaheme-associated outer membrane protein [Gammaproteobacteria bacterium]|nr:MtrB/PioB family decaheme-associated outer membrane protein [Pseudomonadales bacterium]MCP5345618.1 MtrB/PioB family decaheme-associated outer membrane protein [Pseudomonadales bacterium]